MKPSGYSVESTFIVTCGYAIRRNSDGVLIGPLMYAGEAVAICRQLNNGATEEAAFADPWREEYQTLAKA